MGWLATTGQVSGEMARGVMIESLEIALPCAERPHPIRWLRETAPDTPRAKPASPSARWDLWSTLTPTYSPDPRNGRVVRETLQARLRVCESVAVCRQQIAQLPTLFAGYTRSICNNGLGLRSSRR